MQTQRNMINDENKKKKKQILDDKQSVTRGYLKKIQYV